MDHWQEQMTDVLESAGWTVHYLENDEWEIGRYSDAGEDFWFSVTADSPERFVSEVQDYSNSFDPEKHAAMWYGANRGEPSSLRALLDDADSIDAGLEDLASHVAQAAGLMAAHEEQSANGTRKIVNAVEQALKQEGFIVQAYTEEESVLLEADFFDDNSATFQTLAVSVFLDEVNEPYAWFEAFSDAAESWFDPSFVGDEGFMLTKEQAEAIQNDILAPMADIVHRAVSECLSAQETEAAGGEEYSLSSETKDMQAAKDAQDRFAPGTPGGRYER